MHNGQGVPLNTNFFFGRPGQYDINLQMQVNGFRGNTAQFTHQQLPQHQQQQQMHQAAMQTQGNGQGVYCTPPTPPQRQLIRLPIPCKKHQIIFCYYPECYHPSGLEDSSVQSLSGTPKQTFSQN